MDKKMIKTDKAPAAIGPYNQAVICGNMVFLSGQIPLKSNGELVEGSIEVQTGQVLENIDNVLKSSGLTRENVVKVTIFLKEMNDFNKVNELYGEFFAGTVFPARSTIEVARLPKDVKIEIEVTAMKD